MKIRIVTSEIRAEQDVVFVRRRARDLARLLGFDQQDQTRIATSVSEIARNAYEYAKGGFAEFEVIEEKSTLFLKITVKDRGNGIKNLEEILDGKYKSDTGMGLGIVGAKRLMDSFQIESSSGSGTTAVLCKKLPSGAPTITTEFLKVITDELSLSLKAAPFGELQAQNQELIQALNTLQEKQQELLLLNRELEETNRGVVALYEELDEKAEALKRADDMKTRFLSNITHEFRTPLGSTVNLTELLLDGLEGALTDEQRKIIGIIKNSNEGLLDLVNDLLDIAKVQAGKIPVRPSMIELKEIFASLRGLMRPLAEKNPAVTLELVEPSEVPQIYADEGKVTQILRNLVSNALKYTNEGEVRVTVSLLDESHFQISVSDTGIGIAPENQTSIFEEFVQIESQNQRKHRGTGLGLSLTRRLISLLGGQLHLISAVGDGSTFYVTLPIRYSGPEEADYIPQATQKLKNVPLSSAVQNLPKVLLIDDEQDERYFLRSVLVSRFRCEIVEASDGVQGLNLAKKVRPRLILLDLSMPDMSGFEVLSRLKSNMDLKSIPVAIHSGMLLKDEEISRLVDAATILSKTESEEDLFRKINRIALDSGLEALS